MKILQVHNKIPFPPKDGGSIAVYNLSEGFAKLDCKVDIIAMNTKKHYVDIDKIKNNLYPGINIIPFNIDTDIKTFRLLFNLIFSRTPYNAERFINKEFAYVLKDLLLKNTYDIIQIEGLYMMPYVSIIRSFSNAKISFRAHNIEHEIWEKSYKHESNFLKKTYLKNLHSRIKRFETSYINTYDLLIPITERDAKKFSILGNNKKVHVCPTGIDSNKYILKNQEFDPLKLFHLGSLDWYPNQEGLIWFLDNIWPELTKSNSKLIFTIAGRNAPHWLIEKLRSYTNVIFEGEVPDAQEFLNAHSIMIIPLLSGSGMRIKILEGMATGKVIVSTSKGAEGIPAKDNTEILIANSKVEFIEKIIRITNDLEKIKKISFQAKSFISDNFDNFAISKALIEFYKEQISN